MKKSLILCASCLMLLTSCGSSNNSNQIKLNTYYINVIALEELEELTIDEEGYQKGTQIYKDHFIFEKNTGKYEYSSKSIRCKWSYNSETNEETLVYYSVETERLDEFYYSYIDESSIAITYTKQFEKITSSLVEKNNETLNENIETSILLGSSNIVSFASGYSPYYTINYIKSMNLEDFIPPFYK